MELTLEEKKELAQLSGYFKKIEITASHLGIDMDEYIAAYRDNGYAEFSVNEKNPKTTQRKDAFKKASNKGAEKVKTSGVK